MIVVLDFGSTLNKALVFDDGRFSFYRFSVSYIPQIFNSRNVVESFRKLQSLCGLKLLGEHDAALGDFYLTSSLPLPSEISNLSLVRSVFHSSDALASLEMNFLEVGYQFMHLDGDISVVNFKAEELLRWLPFRIGLNEVSDYLSNQSVYTNFLPAFGRDLYLEQALAREKIINFLVHRPGGSLPQAITLAGGVFSTCPNDLQSLQVFLDSFVGLNNPTEIFLDRLDVSSTLGVLKLAGTDLLEKLPLDLKPMALGKIFHFDEEIELEIDLGLPQSQSVEVKRGSIFFFPLKGEETARFKFLNQKGNQTTFEVSGGRVGIVVDCRHHPLELPTDSAKRIGLLKDWEKTLGTDEHSVSL